MERTEILARLEAGPLRSGLRNCHHVGLYSIVLDERPDGSLSRIFYSGSYSKMDRLFRSDGHLTLGAHNHDKVIRFTVILGKVWHVVVEPDPPGWNSLRWYRYPFTSAIDSGKFGIGEPQACLVSVSLRDLDRTIMSSRETHTVIATMGAAWHCDEGPKDGEQKYIWSPRDDLKLDDTGLYVPMDELALENAREWLIEQMQLSIRESS